MLSEGDYWHKFRSRLEAQQMTYYGDVFDTPPLWIRIVLGTACVIGGILAIIHLINLALVVPLIVTIAALILAIYLLCIVATGAQVAIVTIGFWAYLGGLVLLLP